jgi:hypothetical protein
MVLLHSKLIVIHGKGRNWYLIRHDPTCKSNLDWANRLDMHL